MTTETQLLREALKFCEHLLMTYEINHIKGGAIEDEALAKIRAALSAPAQPSTDSLLREALMRRMAAYLSGQSTEATAIIKDACTMLDAQPASGEAVATVEVMTDERFVQRLYLNRVLPVGTKLYTTPPARQPASQEQAKWCEYVAGMVDTWVSAEWPHYMHMDEDRRTKAIAGIIERRLWALKREPSTSQFKDPS